MFNKIRIIWHVLRGKPVVYRLTLRHLELPAINPKQDILIADTTFIGLDYNAFLRIGGYPVDVVDGSYLCDV